MSEEVEDTEEIEIPMELLAAFSQGGGQTTWGPGEYTFFGPHSRSILISGELTEELCAGVVSQILALEEQESEKSISVYLNTPGGSVIGALAIYDMLKMCDAKVVVIVMGSCLSAGLIILCAGDERFASKNSMLLYHEPILNHEGWVNSKISSESLGSFYDWNLAKVEGIVLERTGMSREDWKKHFQGHTSKYISVEQALEHNLIDAILPYAKKRF